MNSDKAPFVHLRVHSQYSILDATASIEDLVEKAVYHKMSGLAITDHGNLFCAVDFYKACKEAKIKPIIGCEFYVAPQSRLEKSKVAGSRVAYNLTLLAKNKQGYQNLCKLSSAGYIEGFYYYPRIDLELLEKYHEGLICIAGGMGTRLAHEILHGTEESVATHLNSYKKIFGDDYYLDLQRHKMHEDSIQKGGFLQESWLLQQYKDFIGKQEKVNQTLVKLSEKYSVSLVATNDVHYIEREDWHAHEILLNIQSGEPCEILESDSEGNASFRIPNPKRQTYSSHEYYFKTPEEMHLLFEDVPQAVANTYEILKKCDVEIDLKTRHYPVFIPPNLESRSFTKEEQVKEVEKFLWQLCEEGIPKRYTPERLKHVQEVYPDKDPLQVVKDRLNYEMSIIVPKGMSDYLLIVWDFIYWAKKSGIPMGPGRGSGAGSIVLYLIGVTDIEPLRFHLFFERFINPERISYPDIDVDICMDRRNEVIQYTLQKYGKENVAQIITFNTMKARMAIKDVARVLSIPLSRVNEITKLVPEDLNITLEKALEKDLELYQLYEHDSEVNRLINIAKKLEGSIRNTGIHAAGIIISGSPLTDLIPVCVAKDSEMPVTQFSMKPVEAVGMLKVDFLGLKTLTAIQMCVDSIRNKTNVDIDWVNLPLDNKGAFDILNQGKTLGIFQLESGGMQDLSKQLHLDCFEEIIAVGALYRPGPMDMIPSFINRKHGREAIENDHPWMKDILAETYGIMVYQEQVMQIASRLANFSLGEGDVLRRAMGKKDMEQMAKQREKFRLGAQQNQIDAVTSMAIFDKMEKFAAYGFNKSHAAAYGFLSYVTAYLKANYPKEWMAALLTCDRDDITKVAKFIRECQSMGITMLPPDVNEAGKDFQATSQGIRFAMTGIKGIGEGVVEAIVHDRAIRGPFTSLYQFFKRIGKVGKKSVEGLIDAGCFDFTGWSREALTQSIDPMLEAANKDNSEEQLGVMTLFSLMGETSEKRFAKPPVVTQKAARQEILRKEKALLGFFLTGHPMDEYKSILKRLSCVPLRQIDQMDHDTVFRSAFIVESVQTKISSKNQKKFAILVISDGIERQELPIWSEMYDEKSHLLHENQLLYAVLQVNKKNGETSLACKWLDNLNQANEQMMQACDEAYDRVKSQVAKFSQHKSQQKSQTIYKTEKKVETAKPMNKEFKNLLITVDADQAKLSHILKIKNCLEQYPGQTPVQIHFQSQSHSFAILHMDSSIKVMPIQDMHDKLKVIDSIVMIECT